MTLGELQNIAGIVHFLNRKNGDRQEELGNRILKVQEETGEAAQAWINYIGQNPRKENLTKKNEVVKELFDVAITALVAAYSIKADDRNAFNVFLDDRIESVKDRLYSSEEEE